MPEVKDFYKALGVNEKASPDEIKKAYRKLALQYHPDQNPDKPDAETRFKEIQEAYDTLSDSEKRKKYDFMRKNPFGFGNGFNTSSGGRYYRAPDGTYVRYDQSDKQGGGGFGGFMDDLGVGTFGEIFSKFFGGAPESRADSFTAKDRTQSRGRDAETDLKLSFVQALQGGKTQVQLQDGTTIRINIPKGVRSGFKIRLKGRGLQGPRESTQRGDLYVTFKVRSHPHFRREEDDLFTTVKINAFEAMLGTKRSVKNAYGKQMKITIPKGTQPGDRLRLRNQGVETETGTGDLYVEIEVMIPRGLNEEQRAILKEAAKKAELIG